jgi:hypothetical protein
VVVGRPLLVPRRDAANLLAAVDEPLDPVALAIESPIEGPCAVFVPLAGDGAPHAVLARILPNLTAAIRLVTYDAMRAVSRPASAPALHCALGHELRQESRLVPLAWGQDQRQQLAPAFGSQVDFGTEAPLAAA